MAAKKKAKRKAVKKPGVTKKKAAKKKSSAAAGAVSRKRRPPSSARMVKSKVVRKKGVNKKEIHRAKKRKMAAVAKKKAKKKVAKKIAAVTKKAGRAVHPTRRKPKTGGRKAGKEILDFFGGTDTRSMDDKELNELKLVFLRSYANRGIVRDGCLATGVSWSTYDRWRAKDENFNDACKHAEMLAADRLESEAHRRAHDGYDKPVVYQGKITDSYTEYSDSLMTVLLKGFKQEKYTERAKLSGSVGRPLTLDTETKEDVVSSILGMIKNKPDPVD